jgi:hypothetical protein
MGAPTSDQLPFHNESDTVRSQSEKMCQLARRRGVGMGASAVYANHNENHDS